MQKSTSHTAMLDWDNLRFFLAVARSQTASGAARRLGVDHTTVARRIRELELALGTVLFEKSRSSGFLLTAEGRELLASADAMESLVQAAHEQFHGAADSLAGNVRIGATEGFGSYVLAPLLAAFSARHPAISIDLLPVPHFVSLSKREADLAVQLERPERGQYVSVRLCDYRLRLYATREYLQDHPPVVVPADVRLHDTIGYVDDLAFSNELLYLERTLPGAQPRFCSTSVIAQYQAVLQGRALAILPCFMAEQDPRLVAVLPNQIEVTRHFWLCCREELRQLRRIAALWDYLRTEMAARQAWLMGESPA
ncbi:MULTISPECIES: LysR family transcriptional regulator [unclassified Paludibacterium]|uniref:LysR family transcriptional regulator n=1 Tax=unclassified Paludibacterium TaxID=2618429 RepID=UPI001C05C728|nr:LysR family transcriptional regulator [Paludibacterium sp. B53371]BEV72693.1 LysR family transcriptional regulator [Paludibacterium sp. THUN1379]